MSMSRAKGLNSYIVRSELQMQAVITKTFKTQYNFMEWILLENLTVARAINKKPVLYKARSFSIVSTTYRRWPLS